MEGSFLAPAADDAEPYCYSSHITYFDGGDNATTAHAVTSAGRAVKVTFHLAYPEDVSHFCVLDTEDDLDPVKAEVISSTKYLVLIRPSTQTQPNLYEYLVYQAAGHRSNNLPILKSIPAIHPSRSYPCIVPCDDGKEFVIADLSLTLDRGRYLLDVFSSKTNKWVTWPFRLQPPRFVREELQVTAIGGGAVGWIDHWRGILVCNVLDEHPVPRFIPLPNTGVDLRQVRRPQSVRSVTCCDGIIEFAETERRFKRICLTDSNAHKTMYDDLPEESIIYDSELLQEGDPASRRMRYATIPDGWRVRTCYRHISWDYWRKGHVVDCDDIEIEDPR
ncbi:hypothetical protein ACQ4PT_063646 [Festuca glaucescens]